jgi:hypothetical protein
LLQIEQSLLKNIIDHNEIGFCGMLEFDVSSGQAALDGGFIILPALTQALF